MKALAITQTVLLLALIVFIMVAKQKTSSGEEVGYFVDATPTPSPAPNMVAA